MRKGRSLSPASSSARARAKAEKQAAREEKNKNAAAPKKGSDKFIRDEELLLVRLVLEHKHIIESKRTDDQTSTAKNECWETISNLFNGQLINSVSAYVYECVYIL